MEPEIASGAAVADFGSIKAELQTGTQRWTTRRKAGIVVAVRRGQVSLGEVCRRYRLSVDEFLAWERDYDRYGVPGLRTTRYQIYRITEKKSA
jgi:hypothetical protein